MQGSNRSCHILNCLTNLDVNIRKLKLNILIYLHIFIFWPQTQISSVYSKNKMIWPGHPIFSEGTIHCHKAALKKNWCRFTRGCICKLSFSNKQEKSQQSELVEVVVETEAEIGASGYSVVGGGTKGIFVKDVLKDSPAAKHLSLQKGKNLTVSSKICSSISSSLQDVYL